MKKLTIAIDGLSGCGKSTIARDLAKELNYIFIDSGAMYRGVTLFALQEGLAENGELNHSALIDALPKIELKFKTSESDKNKQELYLNGVNVNQEIRSLDVAQLVSKVAAISEVRKKLVALQQKMGEKGGVVMDGRDIGSVVFPDAEVKIFVTASINIRAERRMQELSSLGKTYSKEEILKNLEERDYLDSTRYDSPLRQMPDSVVIDTSNFTREEQLKKALEIIERKF
jgi:cytidylate kinase